MDPSHQTGKNVFANVLANLGRRSFTLEVMEERGDDDLQSSEEVIGKEGMWGDTDKRPYIQHKAERSRNGAIPMVCTEIRSVCMTAWWGKISYIFWEIRTTGSCLYMREQGGCSCLCLGEGDEPVESLWVRVRR